MLIQEFEKMKSKEILDIISKNNNTSPQEISLRLAKKKNLPHRAIAEQIECRIKAKKKLPHFSKKPLLYDKVALEQSSSEFTANYKSSIISGERLVDLTGGLGVDDFYFSNSFEEVYYCEKNEVVYNISKYNSSLLGVNNIKFNNCNSIDFLNEIEDGSIDWIYIDPSRRDENRRSVDLEFCNPNVYSNLELFLRKSQKIMLKVAPAFDIQEAVKKFANLFQIHIISVDGECKEVLLLLDEKFSNVIPKVYSISLNSKNQSVYKLSSPFRAKHEKSTYPLKGYFYEPDCAIIKSNLTEILTIKHNLYFINKLTPFLTSDDIIKDFPGRSFIILDSFIYNDKKTKDYLNQNKITKANISRRDFRLSVDEIRKKFKLKDGGSTYLFFTSDLNHRSLIIICKKS